MFLKFGRMQSHYGKYNNLRNVETTAVPLKIKERGLEGRDKDVVRVDNVTKS